MFICRSLLTKHKVILHKFINFSSLSSTKEVSILYHDNSDLLPHHILEVRSSFLVEPKVCPSATVNEPLLLKM